METLEYISKLLGKATFDKKSFSMQRTGKGGSSQTLDNLGRELLMPDEIRQMDRNKCILVVGGTAPFYSDKYYYERHKNYRYTSDHDGANSYSYEPAPPPEAAAFCDPAGLLAEIAAGIEPISLETDQQALLGHFIESGDRLSLADGYGNPDGTFPDLEEAEAYRAFILEEMAAERAGDYIALDDSPESLAALIERAKADPGSVSLHGGGDEEGYSGGGDILAGIGEYEVGDDFHASLNNIDTAALVA
jgi:hypothetical protein